MTDKYIVQCVPLTTIKVQGNIYEAEVETEFVISQKGFNDLLGYIKVISKKPFVDNQKPVQPEKPSKGIIVKQEELKVENADIESILKTKLEQPITVKEEYENMRKAKTKKTTTE